MGLGCADCGGECCKGMGSIDLSNLSWEDYLLIGGGFALFVSLWADSGPKRRRKKSASSSGVAGWVWPLLAVGGLASVYFLNPFSALPSSGA